MAIVISASIGSIGSQISTNFNGISKSWIINPAA
ncbi:hypothetical protein [Novosphingobium terrae]|nr:hypothetical protein [Novosphingobium terrae]